MKSAIEGVHEKRVTRADGTVAVYRYDRKSGKRLDGEPGTAQFAASLAKARDRRTEPPTAHTTRGTWGDVVRLYKGSPEFTKNTRQTRQWYDRALERARNWRDRPIGDIRRVEVLELRNAIATFAPAEANNFVSVMRIVMKWAVKYEFREYNPVDQIEPLEGGEWRPWTEDEFDHALTHLAERYRRAVILATYTGQRASDLVRMRWSSYDGEGILMGKQKKTKKHKGSIELWIPCHPDLKRELAAWKAEATAMTILTSACGQPWKIETFSHDIGLALKALPEWADDTVFHGLRKLAAVRLSEAGCSEAEISAITGHQDLEMIRHYIKQANQRRLARGAMRKLVRGGTRRER
jgi:integrase